MDADWLLQLAKQVIHEDRETGNMIHVRMCDDHIADRPPLSFGESDANAAGIDCDAFVDEEARQSLRRVRAPVVIERAG